MTDPPRPAVPPPGGVAIESVGRQAGSVAINILLVEDDENDIRITQRALAKSGIGGQVQVVRDGQQALDYLFGRPPFVGRRRPGLVLMDVNLPKVNGMDVLREVKADPTLRPVPVIVLTTSSRPEDVATAYAHGANAYVCKPIDFARFLQVIADLGAYWSRVACVPP